MDFEGSEYLADPSDVLMSKLAMDIGLDVDEVRTVVNCSAFRDLTGRSANVPVFSDDLRLIAGMSMVGCLYKTLDFKRIKTISEITLDGWFNCNGSSSYFPALIIKSQPYYVPTVIIDRILPLKLMEVGGIGNLKLFERRVFICRKVVEGGLEIKFDTYVPPEAMTQFPFSVIGDDTSCLATCTAFRLGTCVRDGFVAFPYDKMAAQLPLEQGEHIILGKCARRGDWRVVDVISYRRELLLCLLKGSYRCDPEGETFKYGLSSKFIVNTDLIKFLKVTRLSAVDGLQLQSTVPERISSKLNETFVGANFDFCQIYGYHTPQSTYVAPGHIPVRMDLNRGLHDGFDSSGNVGKYLKGSSRCYATETQSYILRPQDVLTGVYSQFKTPIVQMLKDFLLDAAADLFLECESHPLSFLVWYLKLADLQLIYVDPFLLNSIKSAIRGIPISKEGLLIHPQMVFTWFTMLWGVCLNFSANERKFVMRLSQHFNDGNTYVVHVGNLWRSQKFFLYVDQFGVTCFVTFKEDWRDIVVKDPNKILSLGFPPDLVPVVGNEEWHSNALFNVSLESMANYFRPYVYEFFNDSRGQMMYEPTRINTESHRTILRDNLKIVIDGEGNPLLAKN
jgi:hypothetical protein